MHNVDCKENATKLSGYRCCSDSSLLSLPFSISLDEQHQIQIISNEEVMKQLIGCLEHPDLSTTINIDVLICIQNLSYNAYTHKYLANVYLIDTLMKVADKRHQLRTGFLNMDPVLCSKLEFDLAK